MIFNGANANENINISANGSHVRFSRDVGNVTMDVNGIEQIDFNALGGADIITVNDLSGTDVAAVNLNLTGGGGKSVVVNGTADDDAIGVGGDATGVVVAGLAATVNITGADPDADRLTINALGGDDAVDASGLAAGTIQLTANGGDGDDVLIGRVGDTLDGGAGDNVVLQV